MNIDKETLRKHLQEQRKSIPISQRHTKSQQIKDLLFELPQLKKAHDILFYVSFKSEVETLTMIRDMLRQKQRKMYVPFMHPEKRELGIAQIKSLNDLKPGSYDVLEPELGSLDECDPSVIDVALIPGLGFDRHGYRLGYGKGYYDKFLEDKEFLKIGVAFACQIQEKIPVDPWDVAMDILVTEKGVINVKSKSNHP
ncbi:5-formyltetrahydrofolate cyclo-ligase [Candidatus Woesearchaeota archaeon]|nr:5-formyltetrahydrofolate cyclo-ligase [Candidatus Woesearchaeota archaeon]